MIHLKLTVTNSITVCLSKRMGNHSVSATNVTLSLSKIGSQDALLEDIVEIQYKKLPYPMITESQMREERAFYNKTTTPGKILETSIDNDLEIINHFLFKGKRDVR